MVDPIAILVLVWLSIVINICFYLNSWRKCSHKFVDFICCVIISSNQDNFISSGKRSSNLSRNGGQSLEDQRHDGGVTVLLISGGLHPHALSLSSADGLDSSCISSSNKSDLFTFSLCRFNNFSSISLSDCLHFVSLGFSGEPDGGSKLLFLSFNLLLFNLDLFPPFDNLNLNFFISNLLLNLSSL